MKCKRICSWLSWLEYQSKTQLDYGKAYVIALGCFGAIGHPLWYVYWHYIDPRHVQVYENFGLRLLGMLSSLVLILLALNKLPNPLKKYPSLTYVLILAYNLPFIETFLLLKKSGGDPSYLTYAMTFVATLIIFSVFTGFIIFILFTFLSILLSVLFYLLTTKHPVIPPDLFELVDVGIYALFFCAIFSYNNHQYRMKLIYYLQSTSKKIFHEVKIPLAKLASRLSLLRRYMTVVEETKLARHTSLVQEAQQDVDNIDTLIDLFTVTMTRPHSVIKIQQKERVYLSDLVNSAINQFPFKQEKEREHITFCKQDDGEVNVPKQAVVHVIMNLFKNALHQIRQYGRGKITIRIKNTQHHYVIMVSDTVGSLPDGHTKLIFSAGFTTRNESLGLGLSFCADVMQSLGGKIMCEVNKGETHFTLLFPKETL